MELKYLKHGDAKRLAKIFFNSEAYNRKSLEYCYQNVLNANWGYITDIMVVQALEKLNEARRKQVENNSDAVVEQVVNK